MSKLFSQFLKLQLVVVFTILLLTPAVLIPSPAQAASTPSEDASRRYLILFADCIQSQGTRDSAIIDVHRDWGTPEDPMGDRSTRGNRVAGIDIHPNSDGTLACVEAITFGADRLYGSGTIESSSTRSGLKENVGRWIFRQVTGENLNADNEFEADSDSGREQIAEKLGEIAEEALERAEEIGEPEPFLIQRRWVPLLNTCYSAETDGSSGREEGEDFRHEISSNTTWYFRGKTKEQAVGSVNTDISPPRYSEATYVSFGGDEGGVLSPGAGRRAKLADRNLGFNDNGSNISRRWSFSAGFYPIGPGNGITSDTIASCNDARDNIARIIPNAEGVSVQEGEDGNLITFTDERNSDADNTATSGAVESNIGSGANDNPTCENQGPSTSWLLCPFINGSLDVMDWMFRTIIEPFLVTQPLTTSDDNAAYQAWRGFRTLGNVILVFGLLFIVFGQAIGGGLVDAYTAKKAMPRILAAAIMINVSYFLVAVLVDVTNIIGSGIGDLIVAPLDGQGSFNFTPNGLLSGGGFLGLIVGGTLVTRLIAENGVFMPYLLITVFLPMLVIVISIFGTIVLRRGIILLLAIFSPIAVALYVLPGTEKYARQWFSTLIKTLMVYPIIIIVFAVADLLAVMLIGTSNDNSGGITGVATSSLQQLVGIIVLFIPFFLIPFSFKLAGGVIGKGFGAIQAFGNKRYESYMGSEHDPDSRRRQAKAIQHSKRTARNSNRTRGFMGISRWRIGKDGKPTNEGGTTIFDDAAQAGRRAANRTRQAADRARGRASRARGRRRSGQTGTPQDPLSSTPQTPQGRTTRQPRNGPENPIYYKTGSSNTTSGDPESNTPLTPPTPGSTMIPGGPEGPSGGQNETFAPPSAGTAQAGPSSVADMQALIDRQREQDTEATRRANANNGQEESERARSNTNFSDNNDNTPPSTPPPPGP